MNARVLVISLWVAAVGALLTGFRRYQAERSRLDALARPVVARDGALPSWPGAAAFQSALDRLDRQHPFGSDRVASPHRDTSVKTPSVLPKAQLVVHGIVGGPPWSVVVGGIPMLAGPIVLRPGDSAGGVTVVRIARDSVVLRYSSKLLTFTMKAR